MIRAAFRFLFSTFVVSFLGILLIRIASLVSAEKNDANPLSVVGALLVLFSPLLSIWWTWRRWKKSKVLVSRTQAIHAAMQLEKDNASREAVEKQRLTDSVNLHRSALVRNLDRALRKNDYGVVVEDTTSNALAEFFASIRLDTEMISFHDASKLVTEQLAAIKQKVALDGFDSANLPFDGHSFEKWVAESLRSFGWEAELTSAGGDQGIDVIARRQGKSIGLQCKLYSSPIGNKAIQEAHAGKTYYGLDAAGVLTNSSFTSSAKDLATATGVKLFSHQDIPTVFEQAFTSRSGM